jgi:putative DNA primase/helicase
MWDSPVDGAVLLDEITKVVSRFLSASEHTFKTVALWVIYSYAFDVFDTSPLLAVVSPEKRCGKTTLLTLLNGLVPRPLAIANITASALFRTVEKHHPTLLIDEADSFLTDNEELRGILNSGHRKATAYVIRTTGEEHEPRRFTTWTPKAIALIGHLPGTLEDRSIIIRLERKRANDSTERLRYDGLQEFEHLRQRAVRWIEDIKETLRLADPFIPHEITNDRARDNWRPLLAIADAAGNDWPRLAREVALASSSVEPEAESTKILLLRDLKALFDEYGERLESEKIITSLIEMEGRPWAEVSRGKSLTKTGLASKLRPFRVHPIKWRDSETTVRGYEKANFTEVFARYIGIETPQSPHATESITYEECETPQAQSPVAFCNVSKSNEINDVASVASRDTGKGEEIHCPPQMTDEEYTRLYASSGVTNLNTWLSESKARADQKPKLGAAIWRNGENDQPVTVVADLGTGTDGRRYVSIQGSSAGVPLDEIQYETPDERAEREAILDYHKGDGREVVLGVPQGGPPLDESLFEDAHVEEVRNG